MMTCEMLSEIRNLRSVRRTTIVRAMNRSTKIMVLFVILAYCAPMSAQEQSNSNATVYVTKTGKKYHSEGCRYLNKSMIPMKLKDAATRYSPCSVCNPPILEENNPAKESVVAPQPMEKKQKSGSSGQCQAITKKGTQCKRNAMPGSKYCWQHMR